MPAERGPHTELKNETAVNVAGLLRESTGATREYHLWLDWFPLDDNLMAEDVDGEIRLTRLRDEIIVGVQAAGVVSMECVRCLRFYEQPFVTDFDEEFRQSVDLRTGVGLAVADDEDEDTFKIDANHVLDIAEVLRQEILLALPMRPDCGESCPGPPGEFGAETGEQDDRFAALERLLGEEPAGEVTGNGVSPDHGQPTRERGSKRRD